LFACFGFVVAFRFDFASLPTTLLWIQAAVRVFC